MTYKPNYKHLLWELLAVIHADGGHYTQHYGVEKATEDAKKKYYKLLACHENISK